MCVCGLRGCVRIGMYGTHRKGPTDMTNYWKSRPRVVLPFLGALPSQTDPGYLSLCRLLLSHTHGVEVSTTLIKLWLLVSQLLYAYNVWFT